MSNIRKISLDITEPEYRKRGSLSYSMLAKFDREGFSCLPTLFDSISTPSLVFGSAVDCLLTEGDNMFHDKYIVPGFPNIPPSLQLVFTKLFERYGIGFKTIESIDDDKLLGVADEVEYCMSRKRETRLSAIKDNQHYYNLLVTCRNKIILSPKDNEDAFACKYALQGHSTIGKLFDRSNPNIYYQLKFEHELRGVLYRCMPDIVVVNDAKKTIYLYDLKTSGKPEYAFPESFLKWSYHLQARLYYRIIRACMDDSTEFQSYTLSPMTFIVINRTSLTPLMWTFAETAVQGAITINNNTLQEPTILGNELWTYLQHPEIKVPLDISEHGINYINTFLK